MGTPYMGEIKIFAGNTPPKGWAECNGQFLPINQNQALFSLLGTTYGGNGQTTFALPDLRGRVPFHVGSGFTLGQAGGEQAHTITTSELPAHFHFANASSAAPNAASPSGNFWSNPGAEIYAAAPDAALAVGTVGNVGGSQAHNNMSPYLVLTFMIALQGTFPSRN
jgi:microcystin-dependent protein